MLTPYPQLPVVSAADHHGISAMQTGAFRLWRGVHFPEITTQFFARAQKCHSIAIKIKLPFIIIIAQLLLFDINIINLFINYVIKLSYEKSVTPL